MKNTRDRLDSTKDELLGRDQKIIALQDEVSALKDSIISMKDSLLEKSVNAVQAVVKEEIQSYSTVLELAATAVCTNLIVYELTEPNDSIDHDRIKEVFQELGEAPVVSKV